MLIKYVMKNKYCSIYFHQWTKRTMLHPIGGRQLEERKRITFTVWIENNAVNYIWKSNDMKTSLLMDCFLGWQRFWKEEKVTHRCFKERMTNPFIKVEI